MSNLIQLTIINKNSNLDLSQKIIQSDKLSNKFLYNQIIEYGYPRQKYDMFVCTLPNGQRKVYTNQILDEICRNAYMVGQEYFAINAKYEFGKLVWAEEVSDTIVYDCMAQIESDIYEDWIKKDMPKEIIECDNEQIAQLLNKFNFFGWIAEKEYYTYELNNTTEIISIIPMPEIIIKNILKGM